MQPAAHITVLAALRSEVARLEHRITAGCREKVVSFGLAAVDAALLGSGLALGALHEVAGIGRVPGEVLWVLEQADIHPLALAAVGLTPDRVVYVRARKPQTVLLVLEEGLRHRGLAGVVAEFQRRAGADRVSPAAIGGRTLWRHRVPAPAKQVLRQPGVA